MKPGKSARFYSGADSGEREAPMQRNGSFSALQVDRNRERLKCGFDSAKIVHNSRAMNLRSFAESRSATTLAIAMKYDFVNMEGKWVES